MLTVAAFLIIALLAVAACETTRARLARLLTEITVVPLAETHPPADPRHHQPTKERTA